MALQRQTNQEEAQLRLEHQEIRSVRHPTKVDKIKNAVFPAVNVLPPNSLPAWKNYPLEKKFPQVPAPSNEFIIGRNALGENIYINEPCADFDTDDPLMQATPKGYESLHDPHLKDYFLTHPRVFQKLREQGLVEEDGSVNTSLKDFNTYRAYLGRLRNRCVNKDLHFQADLVTAQRDQARKINEEDKRAIREAKQKAKAQYIADLKRERQKRELAAQLNKFKFYERNQKKDREAALQIVKREAMREKVRARLAKLKKDERKRARRLILEFYCRQLYADMLRKARSEHKKDVKKKDLESFIKAKREFQENKLKWLGNLEEKMEAEKECAIKHRIKIYDKLEAGKIDRIKRKVLEAELKASREVYLVRKFGRRWLTIVRQQREYAKNYHDSVWRIRQKLVEMVQNLKNESGKVNFTSFIKGLIAMKQPAASQVPEMSDETRDIMNYILDLLIQSALDTYKKQHQPCAKAYYKLGNRRRIHGVPDLTEDDFKEPGFKMREKVNVPFERPYFPCKHPCTQIGNAKYEEDPCCNYDEGLYDEAEGLAEDEIARLFPKAKGCHRIFEDRSNGGSSGLAEKLVNKAINSAAVKDDLGESGVNEEKKGMKGKREDEKGEKRKKESVGKGERAGIGEGDDDEEEGDSEEYIDDEEESDRGGKRDDKGKKGGKGVKGGKGERKWQEEAEVDEEGTGEDEKMGEQKADKGKKGEKAGKGKWKEEPDKKEAVTPATDQDVSITDSSLAAEDSVKDGINKAAKDLQLSDEEDDGEWDETQGSEPVAARTEKAGRLGDEDASIANSSLAAEDLVKDGLSKAVENLECPDEDEEDAGEYEDDGRYEDDGKNEDYGKYKDMGKYEDEGKNEDYGIYKDEGKYGDKDKSVGKDKYEKEGKSKDDGKDEEAYAEQIEAEATETQREDRLIDKDVSTPDASLVHKDLVKDEDEQAWAEEENYGEDEETYDGKLGAVEKEMGEKINDKDISTAHSSLASKKLTEGGIEKAVNDEEEEWREEDYYKEDEKYDESAEKEKQGKLDDESSIANSSLLAEDLVKDKIEKAVEDLECAEEDENDYGEDEETYDGEHEATTDTEGKLRDKGMSITDSTPALQDFAKDGIGKATQHIQGLDEEDYGEDEEDYCEDSEDYDEDEDYCEDYDEEEADYGDKEERFDGGPKAAEKEKEGKLDDEGSNSSLLAEDLVQDNLGKAVKGLECHDEEYDGESKAGEKEEIINDEAISVANSSLIAEDLVKDNLGKAVNDLECHDEEDTGESEVGEKEGTLYDEDISVANSSLAAEEIVKHGIEKAVQDLECPEEDHYGEDEKTYYGEAEPVTDKKEIIEKDGKLSDEVLSITVSSSTAENLVKDGIQKAVKDLQCPEEEDYGEWKDARDGAPKSNNRTEMEAERKLSDGRISIANSSLAAEEIVKEGIEKAVQDLKCPEEEEYVEAEEAFYDKFEVTGKESDRKLIDEGASIADSSLAAEELVKDGIEKAIKDLQCPDDKGNGAAGSKSFVAAADLVNDDLGKAVGDLEWPDGKRDSNIGVNSSVLANDLVNDGIAKAADCLEGADDKGDGGIGVNSSMLANNLVNDGIAKAAECLESPDEKGDGDSCSTSSVVADDLVNDGIGKAVEDLECPEEPPDDDCSRNPACVRVRDSVLNTLSNVQHQLDAIRQELMKYGVLPRSDQSHRET